MDQKEFTTGLKKFKKSFSEASINSLGKDLRFAHKFRKITPFRLAVSLLSCFAGKIETLSDAYRIYNEINKESVQYKPFYNQLAKRTFPDFMRNIVCRLMGELTTRVLTVDNTNPFSIFKKILIHDGSSYAIKSNLKHIYPGKFKQGEAAVQLHTTMSLLEDEVISVTIAPFKDADVDYLPHPKEITGSLLLIDRAYLDFFYLKEVDHTQGSFIVRSKRHINPIIRHAQYDNGKKINRFLGKKLKEITLPKKHSIDLDVESKTMGGSHIKYRLLIKWNKETKEYTYLMSNLSRDNFSASHVFLAYRLRWQVELLFKEWKSYANLQKFDTSNQYITEGLIWAALSVAIVKRFMAHLTQAVTKTAISTRIVAMCIGRRISVLAERLIHHDHSSVEKYFKEAISFISGNAMRTNRRREMERGRGKLGFMEFLTP